MEGLGKIEDGSWESWYKRNKGMLDKEPAKPGPGTFIGMWVEKHNLKPRQSNGKLYGLHSLAVLQVLTRKWLTEARGEKTLNFVKNLLGTEHEATIDVWADRLLRRLSYEKYVDRWRILSGNQNPPSGGPDFRFAQKAFRIAADKLGWDPDALQAALWFSEKKLWAENNWSRLDLGDFRNELEKVPNIEAAYQERTGQKEFDLVQPRRKQ
jgi:hypothetical protein